MNECIICENITDIIQSNKSTDIYYACGLCEFISKDKKLIVSEHEELKHYNFHNNSIEDPRYVEYFHDFLNKSVVPFTNQVAVGLDFGSGPAPVLAQILERDFGYKMDKYDYYFSPEKVYEGKKYDLITSTEVVEHLEKPLDYFKKFKELMKNGSILAIMTQFHKGDKEEFLKWYYIKDVTHISFYTLKTMEYIASKVGLKIIYTDEKKCITFVLDK